MGEVGVISLCFKDFNSSVPFKYVNSLEDQPMFLLFNEICGAFFEINQTMRLKKG